jgi:hypothetical protein
LSHAEQTVIDSVGYCPFDAPVEATGAAAIGLPEHGKLIDGPPGTPDGGSRGLAAGDFVLSGAVTLPGAVPAATVDRVCRFTPGTNGALALVCIGPAPEARCTGRLDPVAEAP